MEIIKYIKYHICNKIKISYALSKEWKQLRWNNNTLDSMINLKAIYGKY
jgi:hypothetical protein